MSGASRGPDPPIHKRERRPAATRAAHLENGNGNAAADNTGQSAPQPCARLSLKPAVAVLEHDPGAFDEAER
jgi:hypothetical protein